MEQEFIAFVNLQRPDRQINHNDWAHCAVGDFVNEYLGKGFWETYDDYNTGGIRCFIVELIGLTAERILHIGSKAPNTYGELAKMLEESKRETD